jgi:hypothetical protein
MTGGNVALREVLKACEQAHCEEAKAIKKMGKRKFTLFSCRIRILVFYF